MAPKFAIIVKYWNKDEVKFFETIEEAERAWEEVCNMKFALKTDGGKRVVVSNPRLGYLSNLYAKVSFQKSW